MRTEETAGAPESEIERIGRKVDRRLMPLLFAIFVSGFIDRINIGFAALTMNKEIGLSGTQYGVATSIFYVGYILFELPSNLALKRYGARLWIPRIMVSWGICAAMTALAVGPVSLSLLRLLVGTAEAGLMPGMLLYLTYWVPRRRRAKSTALLLVGQPFTIAIGSLVSGLILRMDGVAGLSGWRWLFVIEAVPSIILGVVAWFLLIDRPHNAKWLTTREATLLEEALAAEQSAAANAVGPRPGQIVRELASPAIATMCLIYFCMVVSLSAISIWTPQLVGEFARGWSPSAKSMVGGIPAAIACVLMIWLARRSDVSGVRRYYAALPLLAAAAGWIAVGYLTGGPARFAGLTVAVVGSFASLGVFWAIPPTQMSVAARPAGLAIVTMSGMVGSIVSPIAIGALKDWTGGFGAGLLFMAVILAVGAALLIVTPFADRTEVLR